MHYSMNPECIPIELNRDALQQFSPSGCLRSTRGAGSGPLDASGAHAIQALGSLRAELLIAHILEHAPAITQRGWAISAGAGSVHTQHIAATHRQRGLGVEKLAHPVADQIDR